MHPHGQNFSPVQGVLRGNGLSIEIKTPVVMGIINFTVDSFYPGSRFSRLDEILSKAEEMINDGASIIDIGAASSRPGAALADPVKESETLVPVLGKIRKQFPSLFLSVDTYNAYTARIAFDMGVNMINDISGGTIDPGMFTFIAGNDIAYVLMHTRDIPMNMQSDPIYENVISDIYKFFSERLELLKQFGKTKDILVDPGFGFGKTLRDNYLLLSGISRFRDFEFPVLAGLSRKSMIYKLLGVTPADALHGTGVLNTIALLNGASVLRVHDVKQAVEVVRIIGQYQESCV